MENKCYELCPHCNCEVELENEFKVQYCPECGKNIVPCSICPLQEMGKCSTNCPLEEYANKLNNKKRYTVKVYYEYVAIVEVDAENEIDAEHIGYEKASRLPSSEHEFVDYINTEVIDENGDIH
jgi:predicted RNA-binding Zn-ribbon protein involved in translation (DUF1610 family)